MTDVSKAAREWPEGTKENYGWASELVKTVLRECWCAQGGGFNTTLAKKILIEHARPLSHLRDLVAAGDRPLDFALLQQANIERAVRWHRGGLEEWSVNDWLTAFGGEAGEALNAGKKHRRLLSEIQQHGDVPDDLDAAEDRIMEELADTVIYADLVASRLGRRLGDAIVAKFNAISEREGFPERLPERAARGGE